MFDPSLVGMESSGLQNMIYDSIFKTDIDLRADFFKNIVLSGITFFVPFKIWYFESL